MEDGRLERAGVPSHCDIHIFFLLYYKSYFLSVLSFFMMEDVLKQVLSGLSGDQEATKVKLKDDKKRKVDDKSDNGDSKKTKVSEAVASDADKDDKEKEKPWLWKPDDRKPSYNPGFNRSYSPYRGNSYGRYASPYPSRSYGGYGGYSGRYTPSVPQYNSPSVPQYNSWRGGGGYPPYPSGRGVQRR